MSDDPIKIETNSGSVSCEKQIISLAITRANSHTITKEVPVKIPAAQREEFLARIENLIAGEAEKFCNDLAIENSIAPDYNS